MKWKCKSEKYNWGPVAGCNSRLDTADKKIIELKDRLAKNSQPKE